MSELADIGQRVAGYCRRRQSERLGHRQVIYGTCSEQDPGLVALHRAKA